MKHVIISLAMLAGAGAHAATPDISGPWVATKAIKQLKAEDGSAPPLTAAGKKLYAANQEKGTIDPMSRCLPAGNPRQMNTVGYPFNIVQGTDYYAVLYQWNHRTRAIFMNTDHFKNLGPGFFGQGVGKWQGDTLVVDTTRYNDKTWLDDSGLPHSKELHTVERFRLRDANTLELKVTFSDPVVFTHDWSAVMTYTKKPGVVIEEDNCVRRLGITLEDQAKQKSGG